MKGWKKYVKKFMLQKRSKIMIVLTLICAFLASFLITGTKMQTVSAKTKKVKNVKSCDCVYESPYVIQITWYSEKAKVNTYKQVTVKLTNGTDVIVCFEKTMNVGVSDQGLIEAIKKVLDKQTADTNSSLSSRRSIMDQCVWR